MGGGTSKLKERNSTPAARPLRETWSDNIPAGASQAQRNALERLFKYGERTDTYPEMEFTEFNITQYESLFSDEELKRFDMRRRAQPVKVSFTLERKDRNDGGNKDYLNMLDRVDYSVLIGANGGLFTYDGNGKRESLTLLGATSRVAIEERSERDSRQYQRKKRRKQ